MSKKKLCPFIYGEPCMGDRCMMWRPTEQVYWEGRNLCFPARCGLIPRQPWDGEGDFIDKSLDKLENAVDESFDKLKNAVDEAFDKWGIRLDEGGNE